MSKVSAASANPASSPAVPEQPWYKQVWVWFVIAIPASSVVTGIILVTVATKNADDLVLDDWYREGRGTNRSMAAENLAADFGIGVMATATEGATLFRFQARREMVWPEQLTLLLRHRTLASEDREYALMHQDNGIYRLDGALLPVTGISVFPLTMSAGVSPGQRRFLLTVRCRWGSAIEAGCTLLALRHSHRQTCAGAYTGWRGACLLCRVRSSG